MKNVLQIVTSNCWKCNKSMKLAILLANGGFWGPSEFNSKQIILAKEEGVVLMKQHSKTLDENYLANTCPSCGAFIGKLFLDNYLYAPGYKEIEL